jgi:hypothetical protein
MWPTMAALFDVDEEVRRLQDQLSTMGGEGDTRSGGFSPVGR